MRNLANDDRNMPTPTDEDGKRRFGSRCITSGRKHVDWSIITA